MSKKDCTPRIYVAALSAYNSGTLHGKWIDADQDPDDILEEIKAMLKKSPEPNEEEWAIHDYECFGKIDLHEYENIETVAKIASAIKEHGEVFAGLVDHFGVKYLDEALSAIEDDYAGAWDTVEDFVENFYEETGGLDKVPEDLRNYIDWERVAHEWEINNIFTVQTSDGMVHVFHNR